MDRGRLSCEELKSQKAQSLIGMLVVGGFFIVMAVFLVGYTSIPSDLLPAVLVLLGTLGTKFGTVVDFYFGSSKGSQDKDASIPPPSPATKKDEK